VLPKTFSFSWKNIPKWQSKFPCIAYTQYTGSVHMHMELNWTPVHIYDLSMMSVVSMYHYIYCLVQNITSDQIKNTLHQSKSWDEKLFANHMGIYRQTLCESIREALYSMSNQRKVKMLASLKENNVSVSNDCNMFWSAGSHFLCVRDNWVIRQMICFLT
jgi:hypothetical protein